MIPTRHRVLRAALLLVPVAVIGGLLATHDLGVVSAAQAPELAELVQIRGIPAGPTRTTAREPAVWIPAADEV